MSRSELTPRLTAFIRASTPDWTLYLPSLARRINVKMTVFTWLNNSNCAFGNFIEILLEIYVKWSYKSPDLTSTCRKLKMIGAAELKSAWVLSTNLEATEIWIVTTRLLPYRKTGRKPGRSGHVPRDVLCVVLCVVWIIAHAVRTQCYKCWHSRCCMSLSLACPNNK